MGGMAEVCFERLPETRSHDGTERRVGVEMEMAGIDAQAMARAVTDQLGGELKRENSFISHVCDTRFGDFRIELDADLLKSRTYLEHLSKLGIDIEPGQARDNLEDILSRVAGVVVPLELVCPPVPASSLAELDGVRAALHRAGGRGTQSSPLYAFGLQLNIEIADASAASMLAVLRAFFLRYPALVDDSRVDLSRKLSPYIQPFPEDYVVHVLDPDYDPDRDTLIDDFLRFTPTRNRPLDVLPLFAWLDEERVMAAPVERDLIKPRPTWHYRLPNCLVDDPHWNLSLAWNSWVEVERLAADRAALDRLARERVEDSSALRRWLSAAQRQLGSWFKSR